MEYLIIEIICLMFVVLIITLPTLYSMKKHQKRQTIRDERHQLASEVLKEAGAPFIKDKLPGADITWIEMRNEVRRRRRSAPKGSPHMYQFKFQVGKQ